MKERQDEKFQTLLDRHRGIVTKVASTYRWNIDDRNDLVQDICLHLWKSFPKYDDSRPFTTWMYRVALNVAISTVRRSTSHEQRTVALGPEVVEQLPDSSSAHDDADERSIALHRVIDSLDDLSRALLILYMEDKSHQEIGEILGISETNVSTKISRLKQRIREQVASTERPE